MIDTSDITAKNRAAWDASAKHHENGPYWEEMVAGFALPNFSVFDPTMTQTLKEAGIAGARAVQVGCNNGREVLSACAIGARACVGIDQSAAFLEQARRLADHTKHNVSFIEGDIYDMPEDTPRDFDIAFITIGVLNWMPDLAGFFRVVAGLLRPGGRLVIYETHPMLEMFDPHADTPFLPDTSYFRTTPFIETEAITYDGSTPQDVGESYWFVHTLSAIVQGTLEAGLRLTRLQEFPHSIREVDYDIYENQTAQLPMSFLLCATKTA